jgi:hypothetical protein
MIKIPVSVGELVDKITILKIKKSKIKDDSKLFNVDKEYQLLKTELERININEFDELFVELYRLNHEFWDYHDWQREKWNELKHDTNIINIELYKKTRDEHILNDKRAEIKKKINNLYNSDIIEEKQFIGYSI